MIEVMGLLRQIAPLYVEACKNDWPDIKDRAWIMAKELTQEIGLDFGNLHLFLWGLA